MFEGVSDVVQISAGHCHCLALTKSNHIWSWGYGAYGRLGLGDTNHRWEPVRIDSLSDVVCVSGNGSHSLACTSDGRVWAWGYNQYGQCGNNQLDANPATPTVVNGVDNVVHVEADGHHSFAVTSEGLLYSWGHNAYGQLGHSDTSIRSVPTQVENVTDIDHISGGYIHSIIMTSDGDVYTFGKSDGYQLGRDGVASEPGIVVHQV